MENETESRMENIAFAGETSSRAVIKTATPQGDMELKGVNPILSDSPKPAT